MRTSLLALLLLLGSFVPALGQSLGTVFLLDPDDANNYAEFCRREYRIATKQDGPKAAGQMIAHQRVRLSTIPTPETGQTGKEFWTVGAPEWWKRVTSGFPPGSSKTGQAAQNRGLTDLWVGLSMYQRVRATLRASALVYQSLKGLRFEVNAWSMMKNLLTMEEGIAYEDASGKPFLKVPRGAVSISVVPHGKENWREVVALFNDSPWDDPNHKVKFIGPSSLGDIAIDATEIGGDPTMTAPDAMVDLLQRMDAGARSAAESIATIQMKVNQRERQAMSDAFSPRRLASSVRKLNNRILESYASMIELRSILEGRNPLDLQREYENLVIFADDQARAAKAQAEMNAKFYSDLQNQAANVIAELELPDRAKVIAKIEKEYEGLFNLSSNKAGILKDLDEVLRGTNKVVTSLFPALVPYVGGLMLPVDVAGTIKGTLDGANDDTKNPDSDIQAAYRDARVRALAVRLNWILFEELRATRRLAVIQEQVAAANHGLDRDQKAYQALESAANVQNERAAQLYRLRVAASVMEQWGAKK